MIYNLIGSGILVAVGAAGMWAWMRSKVAAITAEADFWFSFVPAAEDELLEGRETISRQTDLIGQLQYKRDKTLEYCKQFRVRGAKVACILGGEQDQ